MSKALILFALLGADDDPVDKFDFMKSRSQILERSILYLINNARVAKELGIVGEQKRELTNTYRQMMRELIAIKPRLPNNRVVVRSDEKDKHPYFIALAKAKPKMDKVSKSYREKFLAVFAPHQLHRLKQLYVQRFADRAFRMPQVRQLLNISPTQSKRLDELEDLLIKQQTFLTVYKHRASAPMSVENYMFAETHLKLRIRASELRERWIPPTEEQIQARKDHADKEVVRLRKEAKAVFSKEQLHTLRQLTGKPFQFEERKKAR